MFRVVLKIFIFMVKLFIRVILLPIKLIKYIKWAVIPVIALVIYKLIGKTTAASSAPSKEAG